MGYVKRLLWIGEIFACSDNAVGAAAEQGGELVVVYVEVLV
jgi:hypothetical protein